ncbi:hypothetical protein GW17_00043615 [Ensete ventricosum]|nr:hypothetical protein GW17_00043615 [Ensete ventricosum]
MLISSSSVLSDRRITMRHNLPPRQRGSHCHLYTPADALTPLSPSVPPLPPLLLCRRWLPLLADSHPVKGRPPLRLATSLLLAARLAVGGSPLWAATPCGRPAVGPLCERRAASGCAREWLPPLRADRSWLCSRVAAAPAGGASARRHRPYGWLSPFAGTAGLPFGEALAVGSHPHAGSLGYGLAVAGRPSSSLPSLQKCSKNA